MQHIPNAEITAIEHTDVFGKKLYYLRITTSLGEHFINIGEKTYNKVKELTDITKI